MTLDCMNRSNAMEIMKMFYILEEQVSIRESNISIMRENLKKFNPKKTSVLSGSFIVSSYIFRVFFYFSFVLIYFIIFGLQNAVPNINEIFLYVLGGVLVVADITIYIFLRKRSKKKKKKKIIEQNKDEYTHWLSQIDNDTRELNLLKPAIADEYKKYNIAPEYRSRHAMRSLYDILYHHTSMTVLDAMKKYDEDERARRIAEAHREAGERISNTIADESRKTRDTINENARQSQEINSAILGRLNDFYFYR